MSKKTPIILLTPGDPDGIGPWITVQTLKKRSIYRGAKVLCVGARKPFDSFRVKIQTVDAEQASFSEAILHRDQRIFLIEAPKGKPGFQSGWAIEKATKLILAGQADALVTGPISKERLQEGGFPYFGHTDFLASLTQTPQVTMMLANEQLRVSLVTTHVSLSQVSQRLSEPRITKTILQTYAQLHQRWGIRHPKIAVLGLNPHAGENGLMGDEEINLIIPTIEKLRSLLKGKATLSGPHPADTFFAVNQRAAQKHRADAVIAMYHDQGLTPVKLIDFEKTVNLTLGLPFVRTSVDHGTAFGLAKQIRAGKAKADSSSMESALKMAIQLSKR